MSSPLSINSSPRDKVKMPTVDPLERSPCPGCSAFLQEPFIRCMECLPTEYLICLQCFANGFENGKHVNSHKYEIVSNDFPIIEYGWSAIEEIKLLEGLSECGPGNWSAIANHVKTKTEKECEQHYMRFYIINARYPLPEIPFRQVKPRHDPIPFKPCEDPCRPLPESHRAHALAGYLAARSDFVEEYCNHAETDVKDVFFCNDDRPFIKSLKLSVVKVYQYRLKERRHRKRIIRRYGLINQGNFSLYYLRKLSFYERDLEEKMQPLMRLQHPIAHDKMLASYAVAEKLKAKINKLKKYRSAGIKSFSVARMYNKLSEERRKSHPQRSMLKEVLGFKNDEKALLQWLQRQAAIDMGELDSSKAGPIFPQMKKQAPPIDLTDLPGVEKLSKIEREFCENARLVPAAYLKYKSLLCAEHKKTGQIRLAQARLLVKIDVNKTRKLFDFLKQQNMIS